MVTAHETHFADRLWERFGISYSIDIKHKLLGAIAKGTARYVAKQDYKVVFWTKVLGRPMYFVVNRQGHLVTCMYDNSYEMSHW